MKLFFPKGVIAGKRSIPFMNRKHNVSARAKNIRNTNSVIRYPSYVLSQALFLEPCLFAMNMRSYHRAILETGRPVNRKKD